jgi:hypothetical protein
MGEAAREHALNNFSEERVIEILGRLYRSCKPQTARAPLKASAQTQACKP